MEVELLFIPLFLATLHIWGRFVHPQPEDVIYLVIMGLFKVRG
jgi:hypothetical protein